MTLNIDGKCVPNCKDVAIRLFRSPTKTKMVVFWIRETDGKACRKSADDIIEIKENM